MAARSSTLTLCRAVVVAMLLRVATPSGDRQRQSRSADSESDLDSSFIFDIGAGRRRLPVAMSAANVRRLPTDAMFSKLGHHFEPQWMSVDRPTTTAAASSGFNRSRADAELVRDLRRLRFTYRDEGGVERRLAATAVM